MMDMKLNSITEDFPDMQYLTKLLWELELLLNSYVRLIYNRTIKHIRRNSTSNQRNVLFVYDTFFLQMNVPMFIKLDLKDFYTSNVT